MIFSITMATYLMVHVITIIYFVVGCLMLLHMLITPPKPTEKTLYLDIDLKLRTMCEAKLLILTPDITLQTHTLRLGINRTYMGIYFCEHNLTFYQYINTFTHI